MGRDEHGNITGPTITNCDGIKNVSGHQSGKALDINFLSDDNSKLLDAPKKGWTYWHNVAVEMDFGREIGWDKDHFEG